MATAEIPPIAISRMSWKDEDDVDNDDDPINLLICTPNYYHNTFVGGGGCDDDEDNPYNKIYYMLNYYHNTWVPALDTSWPNFVMRGLIYAAITWIYLGAKNHYLFFITCSYKN